MLPSLQQTWALLQGPVSAVPPQLPAARHSPPNPPASPPGLCCSRDCLAVLRMVERADLAGNAVYDFVRKIPQESTRLLFLNGLPWPHREWSCDTAVAAFGTACNALCSK